MWTTANFIIEGRMRLQVVHRWSRPLPAYIYLKWCRISRGIREHSLCTGIKKFFIWSSS